MTSSFLRTLAFLVPGLVLLPPGALAQQPASEPCLYVNVDTLPLAYSGPGLGITTQGRINGKPATLLVDTGAFETMLTRTGAERHGLRLRYAKATAYGVGGLSRIYTARVDEFATGPADMKRTELRVIGDTATPPSFDGLAGAPFLLQADLEFSLPTKEIKFFRPSNCQDRFLAYWDENAVVLPFEPSSSDSPNPEFTVLLNGQKLRAIIDSGASRTSVSLDAARRAGLKLDAPGVERLGDVTGIGTARVAHWAAMFDTLQIGAETIRQAEIGVIDTNRLKIDVILGADFLRAHRVLFAMSQQRLYLSYIGGEPLGQRRRIEPWIQNEADLGNADAQMFLANAYLDGKQPDAAKGKAWLERAARGGNPEANGLTGRQLMREGRYAEAAQRLRKALDALPSARYHALWLYGARVRSGQAELGKRELETVFARETDEWPGPIARYYLGKMDEEDLLEEARGDRQRARHQVCLVRRHIVERLGFDGASARLEAAKAQALLDCSSDKTSDSTAAN